ncbi:hypothetical protein PUNSTDRAFT_81850 [Punctularia strigosozonata HHB-11173 SS5]|uniref:uncharacterized protein n=1 Tax=Punctularia strigosozonata (strain HHB-11173) TaxID=741275 RepID=UPI0004417840|nr:uncharacterized protein PUNSTDRAFT_81850 [Punctularia strigosozonata HHB-11173 SS5]EIN12569.1 hypothetical protein PUNSTDRAFT_81850 [Punctularia strigosozonata HHB-11173 SS5]
MQMRPSFARSESFRSTFSFGSLGSAAASTAAASDAPPSYVSRSTAPHYSVDPASGEHRLALNPRPGQHEAASGRGVYVKENGKIRVVLRNQEPDAPVPTYGLNSIIGGEVQLVKDSNVVEVTVQLEARISLAVAEGATIQEPLFSQTSTVWSEGETATYPDRLQFAVPFPRTYQDGSRTRQSPPSYEVTFPGVPGLHAKTSYSLVITVTKRRRHMSLWKKSDAIYIRVGYYPRTRSSIPMIPSGATFLSTFKECPEEWFQGMTTMQTRAGCGFEPIDCHLFIPSSRVYAVTDTIPFHVQLTAPLSSLQAFLFSVPPCDIPSFPPEYLTRVLSHGSTVSPRFSLRVFLYRQITVEVRGQKTWRLSILGEGNLRPLSSVASLTAYASRQSLVNVNQLGCLDWEGEVKCDPDVRVPGFNAGKLVVKDFIVLGLSPPDPAVSPLLEHQKAFPIRLVTDPCEAWW